MMMQKKLALVAALALAAACGRSSSGGGGSTATPSSEDDKTLYAFGLMMGRQLGNLKLQPQELEMVQRGISDAATGATPIVPLDQYGPKVQQMVRTRAAANSAAAAAGQKQKDQPYYDNAAKEQGAEKTTSGLVYKELTAGTGEQPKPTDRVKVNYEGKLSDGTVFDSSYKRNQPATFGLNQVVPCWTEGLQKMKVGGSAQLVCPSTIAYGDSGRPPSIPGGATLTFKIELLGIEPPGAPGPTPMPGGLQIGGHPGMPGQPGMMPGRPIPPGAMPPHAVTTPSTPPAQTK